MMKVNDIPVISPYSLNLQFQDTSLDTPHAFTMLIDRQIV